MFFSCKYASDLVSLKQREKEKYEMLRLEDSSIERDALLGNAYIAVPMEIYQDISGELTITVYSACRDIADAYISKCQGNPFQPETLDWAAQQIDVFMTQFGYRFDAEASQTILEYSAKDFVAPETASRQKDVVLIKTADEWIQYQNKTNAEPDFIDKNHSIACVIVKQGMIVSCACVNDAFYTNAAAEIHVETALEYRNQGFGSSCAAALIFYLSRKNIPVWYKCYENNSASAAIARKCGLRLEGKRTSFVCYADE